MTIQIPSLILPRVWETGAELETVADLVEHTSVEVYVEYLNAISVTVLATEAIVAGVPGVLNVWVELSPYPSTVSTAYWKAIGGGGGALAPVAPLLIVAAGVNLTQHTEILSWAGMHSCYARAVVQTPVAAALPAAFWMVQLIIEGKGP